MQNSQINEHESEESSCSGRTQFGPINIRGGVEKEKQEGVTRLFELIEIVLDLTK